jgi:sugar lactone lactonase YvrE
MPILRPSSSDFTSFVKAAAQYVAPGRTAKVSKSGGVSVALPGLGAVVRTSLVGALASPSTSAVIINGVTPRPSTVAAVVVRVLLGIVTTLAGSGTAAFADGTGTAARFSEPSGVAVTSTGNIIVADKSNHSIRLVTPGGVVTTLAGSGTAGFADGTGAGAQFNNPSGVAVTSTGDIIVADKGNHRIRLVTPGGVVTTLAGLGTFGFANGTGAEAQFYNPSGVAVTPTGDIVVADQSNHRIRLVTPGGVVTTLAGLGTGGFADGTGAGARFFNPQGVAVIPSSGVVVVADMSNNRIRLVTPLGVVTTLAGSGAGAFADGTGAAASFNVPTGVAVTSTGDIVVADNENYRIRMITPAGVVTTLAGSGSSGAFADGTGAAARFFFPFGVAVTPTGEIAVGDQANHRIRVIT